MAPESNPGADRPGRQDSAFAKHVPVMAREVLEWLSVRPAGIYVDCTVGLGGHSALIAANLREGRLIGLDRDPVSAGLARERLAIFPNVTVLHRNYGLLRDVLNELGIDRVDGILIDAGLSSMQLDDPFRGFSFQQESELDMRFDTTTGPSARQFLATVTEDDLVSVLKTYGDVRPARRIAKAVLDRRQTGHLATTADLAAAVAQALPFTPNQPEETRTVFQSIRMAVNDELRWLEAGLRQGIEALSPAGRLVAISFHSGEDRVVKNIFREFSKPRRETAPDGRIRAVHPPLLDTLTPKPVLPGQDEVLQNPRAHCARLRAAQRRPAEPPSGGGDPS